MIDFFIKRPIFAAVIAIITVFIGFLCLFFLPLAQFPNIVPPQIQINTQYLGASSQVVADAVTTPIELAINGVHGLHSMISSSNNLGYTLINANFDFDTNVDVAANDVFTNISNTTAKLPSAVNQNGITVQKVSKNMVMVVNLIDKKRIYDSHFLGNFAEINIVPVLKRITGVGDVKNYGLLQYAIRVWLDPKKMASLHLTPEDVVSAIKDQNQQAALGIFSRPPTTEKLPIQIQITTEAQLKDPERYANIVVKVEKDGNLVKLKDLGRVELGAQSYDSSTNFNLQSTASIGIYQYPNGNAVNIAQQVKKQMDQLKSQFPPGVEYVIGYDTTNFIKESLKEVLMTLIEAIFLVFLVVYLFLQRFRTTMIPCIAIPVSLIGTFAFFALFHFSINTLSLLGLVLAIGLVVDDAIVVVENVERKLEEGMQNIQQATLIATEEVKSPIIATTLILLAVFVPVAFIPGISGMLYNQFALAIAFSVALSGINSLTLSPALCGVLLTAHQMQQRSGFFAKFELQFLKFKEAYAKALDWVLFHSKLVLCLFFGSMVFLGYGFVKIPKTFLPDEDQGYIMINIKKPDGANIYAVNQVFAQIYPIIAKNPGIQHQVMIGGLNIVEQINQPNHGVVFACLKPWHLRQSEGWSATKIIQSLQKDLHQISDAEIMVFNPPSIPGLSTVGGLQFVILDEAYHGVPALYQAVETFLAKLLATSKFVFASSNLNLNTPAIYLEIDRMRAKAMKVNIGDIYTSLQAYYGSYYVNNFTQYGQVYRVLVQADSSMRLAQKQMSALYIRNQNHEMVPLSALVKVKFAKTAYNISHYNLYSAAMVLTGLQSQVSTAEGIATIEHLARQTLDKGFHLDWIGITEAEIKAGNIALYIFMLCLVFVFLFLAALYESWLMPLMILLVVPLAMLGALFGLWIRGLNLDVFGQIGLILLIGLAAKNAILIVEFAKTLQTKAGKPPIDAVKAASLLRLRPILMTSLAFIFGVIPLALAQGAGAVSRQSIGTTVLFGMCLSTLLTLFVVPVFYVFLESYRHQMKKE